MEQIAESTKCKNPRRAYNDLLLREEEYYEEKKNITAEGRQTKHLSFQSIQYGRSRTQTETGETENSAPNIINFQEHQGCLSSESSDLSESDISNEDSKTVIPPQYKTLGSEASVSDLLDRCRKKIIKPKVMTSKKKTKSFKKLMRLPPLPYKCFSCSLTTSDLETLSEHCEVVHKEDLLISCQLCTNFRGTVIKLVLHTAQIHNKLEYLAFCESRSAVTETSIASQYIHEGLYSCLKCELSDTDFSMLKSHVKEVHDDSVYQCLQCDFKAANMTSLKNHTSVNHIEAEPYKCISCNFKSSSFDTVVRHIRRHKGLIGIKSCNMCSFKTELVSDLRKHVRKHLFDETFECFLCHKAFNKLGDVFVHFERLHSMKKSTEMNKCAQCPLTFQLHKDLTDHESDKHSQLKPYTCMVCECSFSTVKQFTQHFMFVHERNDFEGMVIFHKSHSKVFMDTFQKFISSEPSNGKKYCKRIISKRSKSEGEYECHSCSFKSDSTTDLVDHIKMAHLGGNEEIKSKTSPVKRKIKNLKRISGKSNSTVVDIIDNDVFTAEILEDMGELSSNIDRTNCISKFENSTGEMTPTNVRKSSRNRVTPNKYKEVITCEICHFVAMSPELLSKHVAIFHKRGSIISEKYIKVRLERSKFVENLTTTEHPTQKIGNTSNEMRKSKRKEFSNIESECNPTDTYDLNWTTQKTKIRKTDEDDSDNYHPNLKRKTKSKVSKMPSYVKKIKEESDQEMDSANHSDHYRKCHLCDFQSVRADTLLTHVTHHHLEAVAKKTCYHCQVQFDEVDRLKFHAAVAHDENEAFHCGLCGLCIPTSHLLDAHLYYKHRRKMTLKCIHCLRSFGSLKLMKYHMKDHMDGPEKVTGGLFPCAYCSFTTNKGKQFRKHVESIHPNNERFQCKYCSHIGQSIAHYQKHMFELHHKIRQFNCPFCDYCTARRENLHPHIRRMHKTDEKST